jgi:type I restriction-modification system DNA methylase subunit
VSPKKEYGDFQTPLSLARRVAGLIKKDMSHVGTIVEPTCGVGAFLQATAEIFGNSPNYCGFDVNADHVKSAGAALARIGSPATSVQQRDFYTVN